MEVLQLHIVITNRNYTVKEIVQKLEHKFPSAAKLLIEAKDTGFADLEELGIPNDYTEMYKLVGGETEDSDGVFGLNRMLTLKESKDGIVNDAEDLQYYSKGISASVFVPIFQSPGRQQLGYAKFDDGWVFSEYDLGVSYWEQTTLGEYLSWFENKLDSDGFFEDEQFKGLIDKDDL
ncbi:hypothetical protein MNBD_GAMMA12-2953 [hydrothermal vent metagenome]|uniref:Knr4/Smi1-like domain-containing protein n=1 Tax=hydrothermal vent metagenome TaxID=652676 RepID=A0A3B0YAM2_9ZZZZ